MPTPSSKRLRALRRTDKGVVSNAQRLIYAPTHPQYGHVLGLWDEAHFYNHPIGSLGTLSLVDDAGVALDVELRERNWQPNQYKRTFETRDGSSRVQETIEMMSNDTIQISWEISPGPTCSHAVIWTAMGCGSYPGASHVSPRSARMQQNGFVLEGDSTFEVLGQPVLPLALTWNMTSPTPTSIALGSSQGRPPEPRFDSTPFFDSFDGFLKGSLDLSSVDPGLLVYAGMHVKLDGATIEIVCEVQVTSDVFGPQVSCEVESTWTSFFENSPAFSCDQAWLNAYFDYRLFGLRMNAIPGGTKCIPYPAVCEGPGYFRAPITYSAQCHILETRWFKSPALAQGSMLNFIANQASDGRYIGYLGPSSLPGEFFYHANWGRILALDAIHEDPEFLRRAYQSLGDYVAFFDATRDPQGSGLYDILNHYETGQEYMRRYVVVEPSADTKHWGNVFRLKGVDVSVYMYQIKQALADIAKRNEWVDAEEGWKKSAQKTGSAILTYMWDAESEMFFDLDPMDMKRTQVKAAVCFYPYLTDLVDTTHLAGLKRHLNDPNEFYTPYPFPSSSVDDPLYNADGLWKGERKNCPWNGRVWPMTNSHMAEILATCAKRFQDVELEHMTVAFICKYIGMMFFDGDPSRPNSFEHYHPENGRPSVFRGVDDYQHSWILDLIIQYVCGVRPTDDGILVDPFPFEMAFFKLENLVIRGVNVCVERSGTTFSVEIPGKQQLNSVIGKPVFIPHN